MDSDTLHKYLKTGAFLNKGVAENVSRKEQKEYSINL